VDALIYILVAVIGGFGIYLLFKYRKRMTIKAMFSSLLALVSFATCIFFGYMFYRIFEFKTDIVLSDFQLLAVLAMVAVPLGLFVSYSLYSSETSIKHRNLSLLIVGALMGSFMAALLPLYGVIPLVIAISLFDIYSVRRGPIKKIMNIVDGEDGGVERTVVKPQETPVPEPAATTVNITPKADAPKPVMVRKKTVKVVKPPVDDDSDLMLLYETPKWSIGIGDFVIYSMFTAFVLTHTLQFLPYYGFYTPGLGFILPWVIFLITAFGLLAGYTFTLRLLSKRPLLPGLPLAIALGLAAFLISISVMELVNYLAYGKFVPMV
jgi:hypothetical protein